VTLTSSPTIFSRQLRILIYFLMQYVYFFDIFKPDNAPKNIKFIMKFNNSYRQIKKNAAAKELIPFLIPIFQKGLESEAKYEKTNIEILERIVHIIEAIEQINDSIDLLAQEEKDMQYHIKYSIYLIEDILFRFTSIFDKCLHLSNTVHAASISIIKHKNDTENNETQKDTTKKSLIELNKFTRNFREKRKNIASSGCFSEPELDKIQAVFFLFQGTPELHEEQLNASEKQLNNYFLSKKEWLINRSTKLEQLVTTFFYTILPEVQSILIAQYGC
jgi:hypothetical protein